MIDSLALLTLASVALPHFCDAQLRTVPRFHNGAVGHYSNGVITLSQETPYREIERTVKHEACHCAVDKYDIEVPDIFGKKPFVNEYASTSPEEDLCESIAVGGASMEKASWIRGLLRRLERSKI